MTKQLKRNKYFTSNLHIENKCLSIQFSLDGFSFCISDAKTKEIQLVSDYVFDEQTTLDTLLTNIKEVFNSDNDLHHDFNSVEIIHQNNLFTIVPSLFFDENYLNTYLKYNVQTLPNDYIVFDEIESINAKNVYIPYVHINNYLFQSFGAFDFKHHTTVLLEKIVKTYRNNFDKLFFVHVSKTNIDIIVTHYNNLILCNSYIVNSKEDFIYYILFVAEQLQMNPDNLQLYLMGDIDEDSEFYSITYQYIRNISFAKTETNPFINTEDFLNHSYYTLLP